MSEPLLAVRDLAVEFDTAAGPARAVDGVSFEVFANEAVGIVGESGSGKSVTSLAIMGLLPPTAHVVSGEILFHGRDLRSLSARQLREVRGEELAMVFQDPMTSFNPTMRLGKQVAEMIDIHHRDVSDESLRSRVVDLFRQVHIPNPEARYRSYPHEFSGGMRQRAMIAMGTANSPDLLIADEPTTALDVTMQAQVLGLLREMRQRAQSAMLLITHDLGVIAETVDRVVVMYGGRVMETRAVRELFHHPRHPYTVGLLASLLHVDDDDHTLYSIPGTPPTLTRRADGCPFHPRCGLRQGREECVATVPEPRQIDGATDAVACVFDDETPAWAAAAFPHIRTLRS